MFLKLRLKLRVTGEIGGKPISPTMGCSSQVLSPMALSLEISRKDYIVPASKNTLAIAKG